MLNDSSSRQFVKSSGDCPSWTFPTDFYFGTAFRLTTFSWDSPSLTFRKKIIGRTIAQHSDNDLTTIKNSFWLTVSHITDRCVRWTTFFLVLTAFSLGTVVHAQTNKIVFTVGFEYLEGCETGKGDCNPILLTRQSVSDSIKLIFPSGGTQTDVFFYPDSSFQPGVNKILQDHSKAVRKDKRFSGQGKATLDLTGLADGNYVASMLGCGLGGNFRVTISTAKK